MKTSQLITGEQFFKEVFQCFKIDSFKAVSSMDMLLVVHINWEKFLLETKEFGILKDIENFDFFVCTSSKAGIAFKGDLTSEETEQLLRLQKYYKVYYKLKMNEQGEVLNKFFPEDL